MYHVYVIKSVKSPKQTYIGFTENPEARLANHNNGQVPHTAKFKPWEFVINIAFPDKGKAVAFEKYLKNGSGRQFIYRHFL